MNEQKILQRLFSKYSRRKEFGLEGLVPVFHSDVEDAVERIYPFRVYHFRGSTIAVARCSSSLLAGAYSGNRIALGFAANLLLNNDYTELMDRREFFERLEEIGMRYVG